MRTTIVIDDDLFIEIERLAAEAKRPKKDLVNELLRRGLRAEGANEKKQAFATDVVDLGRCKYSNLDNISEILSVAEGENFK